MEQGCADVISHRQRILTRISLGDDDVRSLPSSVPFFVRGSRNWSAVICNLPSFHNEGTDADGDERQVGVGVRAQVALPLQMVDRIYNASSVDIILKVR